MNGAAQLCVFEQWCDPGHGAPTHLHAVEEILRVFEGQAEVWIGEDRVTLTAGQLVVVPAGRKHGFANSGKTVLRIQSTLAEPVFEAAYDDKRESSRRWLPGWASPGNNLSRPSAMSRKSQELLISGSTTSQTGV